MDRFFTFWRKHIKIPAEAQAFMETHAQLKHYQKGEVFSAPDEARLYWCYILDGLVGGIYYSEDGSMQIRWLATPNNYFTGTEHLFTKKPQPLFIEFLRPTTLLLLPREIALEGQRRYPAISELFHILKQHHINRLRKQVAVFEHIDFYGRYQTFLAELPELAFHTTKAQQASFLHISRGSFFRVQKQYLLSTKKSR